MIHDDSCPFSPIIVDKSVRISNRKNIMCSTHFSTVPRLDTWSGVPCDGALHLQEILDNRGRGQRTAAPQVGLSWFTIGNPGLLGAIPLEV
jgi:hypothetical protein